MVSICWPLPMGSGPGAAQSGDMEPPSRGLTTCRRGQKGSGGWWSKPGLQKLALWMWNVTSLMGKEPQLVPEIEKI